uniref:Uncharacterized protein n=1 Tax=Chromera velia CCMP2878 TaxID=1169474 RepID=A0A0G4H6B0_9ALVE|eukprot:Cvel_24815.t1-p1 / transcript=Cvel_24815.t1 / gene=Cvel_24815 / organism=Chromera_velia_CCMP2878 / gene_product=hypothetical protein / transcript_product=hypothetical protein / location=Cvel_scaffold2734:3370-10372(+) / protein_length=496 / sequence_SO=supercontig / SO=protein_coding / is_pseudo=false
MSLYTPELSSSHRRAVFAARFLKPPGFFKRHRLREKPRLLTGPFENPVRRFVRLREKARIFCDIPPPRRIPIPKPSVPKLAQRVEGVPRVSPEVLERRLAFLLSHKAAEQQLCEPMKPRCSPGLVERLVWMRQLTEVRRIYRAQYLQKLEEVMEEEQHRQVEELRSDREQKRMRREAYRQRLFEDRKRRAILRDRLRVDKKLSEVIARTSVAKVKRRRVKFLQKLSGKAKFMSTEESEQNVLYGAVNPTAGGQEGADRGEVREGGRKSSQTDGELFDRNVSVPDILRQLGKGDPPERSSSKRPKRVRNVMRELVEESFELLGEDEPQFEEAPPPGGSLTSRQRAHLAYHSFSEDENLRLIEEKIDMLKGKMDTDNTLRANQNILHGQLLEQLEAARVAFLEKRERVMRLRRTAASRASTTTEVHPDELDDAPGSVPTQWAPGTAALSEKPDTQGDPSHFSHSDSPTLDLSGKSGLKSGLSSQSKTSSNEKTDRKKP